ncbi:MAG TPA: hypothetical protein VGJ20_44135 [Xanthobacteraceae bacterium]
MTYGTQGINTPGHFMGHWFAIRHPDLRRVTLPVYFAVRDRVNLLATLSQQARPQIPRRSKRDA